MSKVISGYFDDAHRGLQRQQSEPTARGTNGPLAASYVQLPPLRSDSAGSAGYADSPAGCSASGWDKCTKNSSSAGVIDFSREQLNNGVQMERYQKALQENSTLARRLRMLQDQLSITTAKKEAFKAQAQRLEKEFKKTRDQSDIIQRELLEARRDAGQSGKEAQEAMAMMGEMRKTHIQEVRLLQRGLANRGCDAASRNRVDEVADLVDKVGRAVVQRDEAIRDKTKMQVQLSKAIADARALSGETGRLRRQVTELQDRLREALRRGKFRPTKQEAAASRNLEDSDEEFELELSTFEKRLTILEEGPAGLDVLASNLAKDKQNLEKRIRQQQETIRVLNGSIEDWKAVNTDKDDQIAELQLKMGKMLQDQALLHEQIAQKRREIEDQVEQEKALLEARIKELQGEVDIAQAQAEGLEKVSSRLTKELVKVHGQYGSLSPEVEVTAEKSKTGSREQEPSNAGARSASEASRTLKVEEVLAVEANHPTKTGDTLNLKVVRLVSGQKELRASDPTSGSETRLYVSPALEAELDSADPWPSLFSRVGVSLGPPPQVVIASRLGEREVQLPPSNLSVILTIMKFDNRRFAVSGMTVVDQQFLDIALMEDLLTPDLASAIDASKDSASVYNLLLGGLSFGAEARSLSFSAAAAMNTA